MSMPETKKLDPQKLVVGTILLGAVWTIVSGHWLVALLVLTGVFLAAVVLFAWMVRPERARGELVRMPKPKPSIRNRKRKSMSIRLVDGTGIEPVAPAV